MPCSMMNDSKLLLLQAILNILFKWTVFNQLLDDFDSFVKISPLIFKIIVQRIVPKLTIFFPKAKL